MAAVEAEELIMSAKLITQAVKLTETRKYEEIMNVNIRLATKTIGI